MPYRRFSRRRPIKRRQTGQYTGASFSGMQDIIRHSNEVEATIQTGHTQCFNLVCYNPTFHGTPSDRNWSMMKITSQIQHPYGFLCVYHILCPSDCHTSL